MITTVDNIYVKLQKIQTKVKELVRTEENKSQRYHYFDELQVLRMLKPLFEEHKLLVFLSDDPTVPFIYERSENNEQHYVRYLKKLEIIDVSTNQKLVFSFWACGSHSDLAKAKGASETYAAKYIFSKLFLIAVRDEADPDCDTGLEEKKANEFLRKHNWQKTTFKT